MPRHAARRLRLVVRRRGHSRGAEDFLLHQIREVRAGGLLRHKAREIETVIAVRPTGSRSELERLWVQLLDHLAKPRRARATRTAKKNTLGCAEGMAGLMGEQS